MTVMGSSLRELSVKREKFETPVKLGRISNNINITNVTEKKVNAAGLKSVLVFEYTYICDYNLAEPKGKKLGEIKIIGEVMYSAEPEKIKRVLKDWKKKKINSELLKEVLSVALNEAQIESLLLSRKVLLPPPVPLPTVKAGKEGLIG